MDPDALNRQSVPDAPKFEKVRRQFAKPVSRVLVVSDNAELASFFMKEIALFPPHTRPTVDLRFSVRNRKPRCMVDLGGQPVDTRDAGVSAKLAEEFDLIFSVHCKQLFSAELVEAIPCVNVHPGFNPCNRGWYPQAFSIVNGKPAGATIHFMDKEVDHGGIIDQICVPIQESDTSLEVYARVIGAEKVLIRRNLAAIVKGEAVGQLPAEEGNYNGIGDYRDLCELDLNHVGSFREHLNLLRATSHGQFKNAYFFDRTNGQKIFVKVSLLPDSEKDRDWS